MRSEQGIWNKLRLWDKSVLKIVSHSRTGCWADTDSKMSTLRSVKGGGADFYPTHAHAHTQKHTHTCGHTHTHEHTHEHRYDTRAHHTHTHICSSRRPASTIWRLQSAFEGLVRHKMKGKSSSIYKDRCVWGWGLGIRSGRHQVDRESHQAWCSVCRNGIPVSTHMHPPPPHAHTHTCLPPNTHSALNDIAHQLIGLFINNQTVDGFIHVRLSWIPSNVNSVMPIDEIHCWSSHWTLIVVIR